MKMFRMIAAATLAAAIVVPATAMSVRPIVLDLLPAGRTSTATVTIENTFDRPITVEISAAEVQFNENGAEPSEQETDDLLIFPPQALIEPGKSQTVRVQYVAAPALERSKHYFITVAQLPVKLPQGQTAIQVLYNFRVLTSVGVPGASPQIRAIGAKAVKDEKGIIRPAVQFQNTGPTYGYAATGRMALAQKNGSKVLFERSLSRTDMEQMIGVGLIAPGRTRTITLPLELPSADGALTAEFTYERAR